MNQPFPTPDSVPSERVVPEGASAWVPPSSTSTAAPGASMSPPAAPASNWQAGAPLGGMAPAPGPVAPPASRRDLLLTAILLVAALGTGAASLLAWRDVGGFSGGSETGWTEFDGGLGRGWIAVLGGVLLAIAGVLVAAEKGRAGRTLGVVTGVGLVVFSVLEWGLGLRGVRSGPGPGLWLLFVIGLIVVTAIGILAPEPDPASSDPLRPGS